MGRAYGDRGRDETAQPAAQGVPSSCLPPPLPMVLPPARLPTRPGPAWVGFGIPYPGPEM